LHAGALGDYADDDTERKSGAEAFYRRTDLASHPIGILLKLVGRQI
jgi:hypothetical protein